MQNSFATGIGRRRLADFLTLAVLMSVTAFGTSMQPADAAVATKTTVGISGTNFTVNGAVTNPGLGPVACC